MLGKRGGQQIAEIAGIARDLRPRLIASNSRLAFPITAMTCDFGDSGDL
jgi:hypothetical protein